MEEESGWCWIEKVGHPKLGKMARWCESSCCGNEIDPATRFEIMEMNSLVIMQLI